MSDDQGQPSSKRPTEIDFLIAVDAANRVTFPEPFAKRFGIEPGVELVFIDSGRDAEFTVRIVPSSYAGALAGAFGTTEENVAYVERERAAWDALEKRIEATPMDDLEKRLLYVQMLGDMTRHLRDFKSARLWLDTRQPELGDRTPLDIIETGNRDAARGLQNFITSLTPD